LEKQHFLAADDAAADWVSAKEQDDAAAENGGAEPFAFSLYSSYTCNQQRGADDDNIRAPRQISSALAVKTALAE